MGAMPIAAAVGGGLGLIQNHQKQAEYNRQKELASQTERYSPWTGVHGTMPTSAPNAMSSLMQGAMQGASFGQGMGGAPAAPAAGAASPSPYGGMMAGGMEQSPWFKQPNYNSPRNMIG